ncbi:MAG: hypothetical protein R3F43_12395 [bacterium]
MAGQYTIRDGRKLRGLLGQGHRRCVPGHLRPGTRLRTHDRGGSAPSPWPCRPQESGFFLDFGTQEALVYDTGVCLERPAGPGAGLARGDGGSARQPRPPRSAEEEADLAEIFRSSETREDFFGALRARTGPDTGRLAAAWGTPPSTSRWGSRPPRTT